MITETSILGDKLFLCNENTLYKNKSKNNWKWRMENCLRYNYLRRKLILSLIYLQQSTISNEPDTVKGIPEEA